MNDIISSQPVVTEVQDLLSLKAKAARHHPKSLEKAAQQFEALFLQQILKSMRKATHFLSEDSPLKSKQSSFFEEMLDQQRSLELSKQNVVGIAKLLKQQLDPEVQKIRYRQKTETSYVSAGAHHPAKSTGDKFAMMQGFVKQLWPIAKQVASTWGFDPKMLIAQAAHETGWGQFINKNKDGSSSFNIFNIKAGKNWLKGTSMQATQEYSDKTFHNIIDRFRSYHSLAESFYDYIALITENPRYQQAKDQRDDAEAYFTALQNAGYATDPNYAKHILSIYRDKSLSSIMGELEELK